MVIQKPKTTLLLGFALFVATSLGCLRNGYECQNDGDCFSGEVCSSGSCEPELSTEMDGGQPCEPEDDATLCARQETCQVELTTADNCGDVRTVTCDCENVCTPPTADTICQEAGAECGSLNETDSCGDERLVMCGSCPDTETCVENVCTECAPPVCGAGAECGTVVNACGDEAVCVGTCEASQICLENSCVAPKIEPAELAPGDRFGQRVVLDGDLLVIGAPGEDGLADDVGALYVYERIGDGWIARQKLENPNPEAGHRLGEVFDVRGDLIVAAAGEYLFSFVRGADRRFRAERTESGQPTIVSLSLTNDDRLLFGIEDTDGETDSLGINSCDASGCGGFANTWDPRLQAIEFGPLELGAAIDTDGDYTIVGAPGDNIFSNNPDRPEGSAYLMSSRNRAPVDNPSEWTNGLDFYLKSEFDNFESDSPTYRAGLSVAIHRDGTAAYGAPDASPEIGRNESGEYFIHAPSMTLSFTVRTRFVSPVNMAYMGCGRSLAFTSADSFFASCVSRYQRDDTFPDTDQSGTAGLFYRYQYEGPLSGWMLVPQPIQPNGIRNFDQFGWSMDGSADFLIVGAPGRSNDSGAVYIYTPDTWTGQ